MCLISKNKKFILDKDIFVYKWFGLEDNVITSFIYHGFTYEKNHQYSTNVETSHDYSSYDNYAFRKNNDNTVSKSSYGPGFHSALSIERLFANELKYRDYDNCWCGNTTIYKCKIAKGSECVIDDSGLIISSSIELLNEINEIEYRIILAPSMNKLKEEALLFQKEGMHKYALEEELFKEDAVYISSYLQLLFNILETSYSETYKHLKTLCA